VLAEWIELKETLAKFQAARGKETSDDKGSDDLTSKAERKQKSDAHPAEFCRRSLAGGNVWDSLADLLEVMKLRGAGADDVQKVQEIEQHLFTNLLSLHVVSEIADMLKRDAIWRFNLRESKPGFHGPRLVKLPQGHR